MDRNFDEKLLTKNEKHFVSLFGRSLKNASFWFIISNIFANLFVGEKSSNEGAGDDRNAQYISLEFDKIKLARLSSGSCNIRRYLYADLIRFADEGGDSNNAGEDRIEDSVSANKESNLNPL